MSSAVACAAERPPLDGFGRQRHGAVEQGGDLRESAVGGLQQADAVGGVLAGLGESRDVCLQTIGDREAGGVV